MGVPLRDLIDPAVEARLRAAAGEEPPAGDPPTDDDEAKAMPSFIKDKIDKRDGDDDKDDPKRTPHAFVGDGGLCKKCMAPKSAKVHAAKAAAADEGKADDEMLELKATGEMERKADPVVAGATQVLEANETTGQVRAVVSVTGVEDRVKDIIEPGAYVKSIAKQEPIGVWSHDDKTWVARADSYQELLPGDPGLKELRLQDGSPWPAHAGAVIVDAAFNLETPHGAAAFSDVKFFKGKTSWSIGYRATRATRNQRTGVRHIKELDWFEFSPVMVGANQHAMTLSVKSLADDYRVDPDDATGLVDEALVDELTADELVRYSELKGDLEPLEEKGKPRIIRTAAGARRFGGSIGDVIRADGTLERRSSGGARPGMVPDGRGGMKPGMVADDRSADGGSAPRPASERSGPSAGRLRPPGAAKGDLSQMTDSELRAEGNTREALAERARRNPVPRSDSVDSSGRRFADPTGQISRDLARADARDGDAGKTAKVKASELKPGDEVDFQGMGPGGMSDPITVKGRIEKVEEGNAVVTITVNGRTHKLLKTSPVTRTGSTMGANARQGERDRIARVDGSSLVPSPGSGGTADLSSWKVGDRGLREKPLPGGGRLLDTSTKNGQTQLGVVDADGRSQGKMSMVLMGTDKGKWIASSTRARLGTFDTAEDAVAAIRKADPNAKERADNAAGDAKDGLDVQKLAAVNKRRRARGLPPLMKLPPEAKALDLAETTDDELCALEDVEVKGSRASLNRSPRKNWVEQAGDLPGYIREVARAIEEEQGLPLDRAIPIAIGRVKKWARGGGGVKADTVAKAAAAVAQWEALKAKSGKKYDSELLDEMEQKATAELDAVEQALATLEAAGYDVEVKTADWRDALEDELNAGEALTDEAKADELADPDEVLALLQAGSELKAAVGLVDVTDLFAAGAEFASELPPFS